MLKYINKVFRLFGFVLVKMVDEESKKVVKIYFEKAELHPLTDT